MSEVMSGKDWEIDMGVKFGYGAITDERRGYGWPKFFKNFTNGVRHVWSIRDGWQTADLIDGRFQNHQPLPDLEQALGRPIFVSQEET